MIDQVTFVGESPVTAATNGKVSPVPIVAVGGLTVMRIPESKVITADALFFLSAFEVAVMLIVGTGLGTVAGASYSTVVL